MIDFKSTLVGKISEEWGVVGLGDKNVADMIMGQSPPSSTYNDKGIGLPFLQGNAEFGVTYPKPIFWCSQPIKIAEKNDILLSVRAPVGDVNINPSKSCIGRGLAAIRTKSEKLNHLFLFYYLKFGSRRFESLSMGSTFKAIRKEEVVKFQIPLPHLPEQRRIAEVLGTVDSAIQSVGGAIESTERLKKGLMQRLLMRGIGYERFKESEVGRVPEEWEVARLGDAVEINRESRDPTRENPDGKFLYIDIESVVGGTGAIKSAKEIFGKDAPSRARRIIHQNDVIMSTVRPYLKAFALVPREYNNQICSTGFAVLSCKDEILPHYLLYTIFSKMVIDQCNKMMMGGQYPALNQSQVAKIEIPLPLLPEQRRIAEILSAADRKLELERRRKEKLERVKQGLMNDLLTGRKRIKINV